MRLSDRELYYYLVNIDEYYDLLPRALTIVERYTNSIDQDSLPKKLHFFDFNQKAFLQFLFNIKSLSLESKNLLNDINLESDEHISYILRQYTPIASIDGCWLQNVSTAITSHLAVNALLLKLHSFELGNGDIAKNHSNYFTNLINSVGLYLPDIPSWEFLQDKEILNSSFKLPVFYLAISQFPRIFLPELLGVNLFAYIYIWDLSSMYKVD